MLLFLTVLLNAGSIGHAQTEKTSAREEEQLILGFMNGLFSDVHISDALAATKVWATELKSKKGFEGPADAVVYDDIPSAMEALTNKRVDLLVLISWQYLEVKDRADIDPYFVTGRGENIAEESVLLVNGDSGMESLEDLKGKNLLILNNVRAALGRVWLETLLFEKGIADIESYFGSIQGTDKSSKTVLPVFFGQADACLIHRSGFDTMCDLNPQLRKKLKIINISPPLLPSLMCIRRDYPDYLKTALIDALKHLHEEPRGLQILTLFKVDKVFPYDDAYLQHAKALLAKHSELKRKLQKKGEPGISARTRISQYTVANSK